MRSWLRVALLIALLPASTAPAVAAGVKGIWGPAAHNGNSLFPVYRELGVTLYEDDLHWNLVATRRPRQPRNPRDPAYVWPVEVTNAVREAKRYGIQVALQIIGAPGWANGNKAPKWATFDPRTYANFAIAAS